MRAPQSLTAWAQLEGAKGMAEMASALLDALDRLDRDFPGQWEAWLERYRRDCLTIGSQVQVIRGKETRPGRAVAVDDQFALVVEWEDGSREAVSSGEVSVRGLLGYV